VTAPRDPEAALLLAVTYRQLGGSFVISSDGTRRYAVTELDGDQDHLRLSIMLERMLSRLHPDDKAFVFDAYGEAWVDPAFISATVEEPRRAA
jgi:hypothetical protein